MGLKPLVQPDPISDTDGGGEIMEARRYLVWLPMLGLMVSSCGVSEPGARVGLMEIIDLPAPDLESDVSLEETLANRRSVRGFTGVDLTLEELSQLLWSAQGITREWGGRTNPSAGALYPIEMYVATRDGLYHYLSEGHRLELPSTEDLRSELYTAAHRQEAVRDAPAVFVICAVFARTAIKYGDRATRYVHLEAGHVGQSLILQAVALDLGAVTIGAFLDGRVQEVLGVPNDYEPLYLIPVGHPA